MERDKGGRLHYCIVAIRHTLGYIEIQMTFIWKPEKNEWLKQKRLISFEEVLEALVDGGFQDVLEYRGKKRVHQGQKILIILINGTLWKVPHTIENEFIFLRTAYPA
jgi:uncharacterized DUF497 family protein